MAILGRNRERSFTVWWGRGRNGKSALATALRLVLDSYAATTPVGTFARLAVEDSERPSPELASLVGRRLVVAHEPQERVKLSASFIKNITGNDAVKTRELFHPPFEFWPDFLAVVVTNHLPDLPGTDQALWDRLHLIPFLWRVPDDQVVPGLGEKLAQEEGPGILRWLVEGVMAYLREGLRPPPEVQAATAQFRAEADDLYRFFIEETEAAPQASTPYRDIRQRYEDWCKGEGVIPTSDRRLADALRALGYRRRKTMDGVVYDGVRLKGGGRPQPEGDRPMTDMNDMNDSPTKFPEHHDDGPNYGDNRSYRSYPSSPRALRQAFEEEGAGDLLGAEEADAGPPIIKEGPSSPPESPPHPPQPCPRCQPAGVPGYYACERGQEVALLRVAIGRERHVLRSRQAICFNSGLLRAIEPDFLVVSFSDGSWGWVTLATAKKLGHEGEFGAERQLAVPLGVFAWEEAAQGEFPNTGRLSEQEFPNTGFPNREFPNTEFPNTEFPNRAGVSEHDFPNRGRVSERPEGVSEQAPGVSEHYERVSEQPARGVSEQAGGVSEQPARLSEHLEEVSEHPGGVSERHKGVSERRCPGCGRELSPSPMGRPRRWCSDACRMRHRRSQGGPTNGERC